MQRVRALGPTYVSKEEEGQQEGEASPHPRLEALCEETGRVGHWRTWEGGVGMGLCLQCSLTHCKVHGVPLAQGPKTVKTAALVVVLQELHKT